MQKEGVINRAKAVALLYVHIMAFDLEEPGRLVTNSRTRLCIHHRKEWSLLSILAGGVDVTRCVYGVGTKNAGLRED